MLATNRIEANLRKTLSVMKSASRKKEPMAIWADDIKAVEDAADFLSALPQEAPAQPQAARESAVQIVKNAREIYESHEGDGAWLAMEKAYVDLISAALSPTKPGANP